jgi:hypothetical protein
MRRNGAPLGLFAVATGLAIGVCLGMVLLVRQASQHGPVELSYADPDYVDWIAKDGGADLADGFRKPNPEDMPLGMYYPEVLCSKPPCGCCGEPFKFEMDPADIPTPEQEVIDNYKMPADEVNLYKKAWNRFDGIRGGVIPTKMPDGTVDIKPLRKLVKTLGTNPSPSDLKYTLGQIDPEGKGIDYPDFLLTMARHAPAWPVAVSESLAIPLSSQALKDPTTRSNFKKALALAAEVLPEKVSIVGVRDNTGSGVIVDVNIDASTDDMELMKAQLTTDTINEALARFSLPGISKGPEYVRGVETLTLPVSADKVTGKKDELKQGVENVISQALAKAGLLDGAGTEVSIVRIQSVNGRPEQASVDIGLEAKNDKVFSVVKKALSGIGIYDALVTAGLPSATDNNIVTLPSGFTPGCSRCGGTSPYVDGDDLGKDWVGNAPFDEPLSRYVAGEVHRFDSVKPSCQCDDEDR